MFELLQTAQSLTLCTIKRGALRSPLNRNHRTAHHLITRLARVLRTVAEAQTLEVPQTTHGAEVDGVGSHDFTDKVGGGYGG